MQSVKLMTGAVLLAGLLAGTAWGQADAGYPVYQSTPAQQTAYDYNGYLFSAPAGEVSPSPSDVQAASPSDVQAAPGCDSCGAVSSDFCVDGSQCGEGGGQCSNCFLGEPWKLFPQPHNGITAGGWVTFGGYGNDKNDPTNGPLGFNNVGDGFTMPQLWGFLEKAVDTGGYGWDFGGRVDYVFGADGPNVQAFGGRGWDNNWDSSRDYGSAIPQLYFELGYNDWTIKAGHFFTIMGYEVAPAPDNFFFSHSYTFIYGEPLTHTGAMATYQGYDNWTFYGGWTEGWDTGFDSGGGASTFLGGASYSVGDDASLTYTLNAGDFGTLAGGDIYVHSIVLELGLSEQLTWIIQSDLGVQSDLGARRDNIWGGVNQYLEYEFNDCWAAGFRFEWFHDRDGSRVSNTRAGNYYNLTAGINYRPQANIVFRPEIRYDWFSGTFLPGNNLPFDSGRDNEQVSGGFDLIFTF